jgi:DNA-binding transcriptional LysR family regulator
MVWDDVALPAISEGKLVHVLEDWCQPFSGYHLYYADRRHPSAAFTALLRELRARALQRRPV